MSAGIIQIKCCVLCRSFCFLIFLFFLLQQMKSVVVKAFTFSITFTNLLTAYLFFTVWQIYIFYECYFFHEDYFASVKAPAYQEQIIPMMMVLARMHIHKPDYQYQR